MSKVKHEHNDKYTKREVCDEKHRNVNERCQSRTTSCDARFDYVEKETRTNTADIRTINRKIDATLIFAVATLLTLIIGLVTGRI